MRACVRACVLAAASSESLRSCLSLWLLKTHVQPAQRRSLCVQIVLSAAHTCTWRARLRNWKEFPKRVSLADFIQA